MSLRSKPWDVFLLLLTIFCVSPLFAYESEYEHDAPPPACDAAKEKFRGERLVRLDDRVPLRTSTAAAKYYGIGREVDRLTAAADAEKEGQYALLAMIAANEGDEGRAVYYACASELALREQKILIAAIQSGKTIDLCDFAKSLSLSNFCRPLLEKKGKAVQAQTLDGAIDRWDEDSQAKARALYAAAEAYFQQQSALEESFFGPHRDRMVLQVDKTRNAKLDALLAEIALIDSQLIPENPPLGKAQRALKREQRLLWSKLGELVPGGSYRYTLNPQEIRALYQSTIDLWPAYRDAWAALYEARRKDRPRAKQAILFEVTKARTRSLAGMPPHG